MLKWKRVQFFSDSQCITSIAAVMKHCQNFKHGFQSSGAVSCRQARPFRAFRRGILVAAPYDAPMKWALIIKQLTDKDDGWCDAIYRAPLGCLVQPTAVPVTDNTNGQYRIWFRSTTTLFCQGCQRVTVSRFAFQRRLTLMRYHDADGDDSLTGLFSDSQSYFCETCERCLNRLRAKTRVVAITNLFLPSAEQSCLNPTGD